MRSNKFLVYLSGAGADETLSDYGFNGTKFFMHSNFGGLFPTNLSDIFPWPSFYLSTQRDYLMKEELVAGSHGVEARYPFLDPEVVQEFLWLSADVKNANYKAPLRDLFIIENYPFIPNEKVGFNAGYNVDADKNTSTIYQVARRKELGKDGAECEDITIREKMLAADWDKLQAFAAENDEKIHQIRKLCIYAG